MWSKVNIEKSVAEMARMSSAVQTMNTAAMAHSRSVLALFGYVTQ